MTVQRPMTYEELLEDLKLHKARADKVEAQVEEARDVAKQAIEAFRLTQEYVTPKVLPDIEGWSHYDAKGALEEFLAATTPKPTSGEVEG